MYANDQFITAQQLLDIKKAPSEADIKTYNETGTVFLCQQHVCSVSLLNCVCNTVGTSYATLGT
jgi:hypothetical protein